MAWEAMIYILENDPLLGKVTNHLLVDPRSSRLNFLVRFLVRYPVLTFSDLLVSGKVSTLDFPVPG